jgi:hypothetical protein
MGGNVYVDRQFMEGVVARMVKDDDKAGRLLLPRVPSRKEPSKLNQISVQRGACLA